MKRWVKWEQNTTNTLHRYRYDDDEYTIQWTWGIRGDYIGGRSMMKKKKNTRMKPKRVSFSKLNEHGFWYSITIRKGTKRGPNNIDYSIPLSSFHSHPTTTIILEPLLIIIYTYIPLHWVISLVAHLWMFWHVAFTCTPVSMYFITWFGLGVTAIHKLLNRFNI